MSCRPVFTPVLYGLYGLLAAGLLSALPAQAVDENAGNKAPVKVVAPDTLSVSGQAGQGALRLYASRDLQDMAALADVERAVLVFHGRLRNANVYWASARKAAQAAGPAAAHSLLLVPQFLADRDVAAHALPSDTLRWSLEGWMGGETATAPAALSSFEAIDALLALLADRKRFPKLSQVVVAGHSGGAQVVQRYAVVGQGEGRLPGVAVRYVVANPSSYLYFHPERPVPAVAAACPGVNQWKYGWAEAPGYASQLSPGAYEARYLQRDVIYLLGSADTNPQHPALDKSCAAEAQGPYRYARGHAYVDDLRQRHPGLAQRQFDVPGVGHDGDAMLDSACGQAALFDAPEAWARCKAP